MFPHFLIVAAAALIPLVIGFIWYHPKVFGTAWQNATGMTEEKMKGANMPVIFFLTYVFSLIIALVFFTLSVHQTDIYSLLMNTPGFEDPNSEIQLYITDLMAEHGRNFRSITHGLTHGIITGLFFVTPIIASNAIFERKGFKYIAINGGWWIVSLALMGAILSAYA